MSECNENNVGDMLSFMFDAPCDEEIIKLDCNDYCEQIADFAERVAHGENLEAMLPSLHEHLVHWKDCREEFEALVAVLKAEKDGKFAGVIDDMLNDVTSPAPSNE